MWVVRRVAGGRWSGRHHHPAGARHEPPKDIPAEVLGADRVGGSFHAGDEHRWIDPSNDTDSGEKSVAVPDREVWVRRGCGGDDDVLAATALAVRPCPTLVDGQGRSARATDCQDSMQNLILPGD